MRALWLENRQLRFRDDVPLPVPDDREALVRVIAAGICNTDIEMTRGYYPFTGVPGHEFVGVVERGPAALEGKRVVGEINAVCHGARAGDGRRAARTASADHEVRLAGVDLNFEIRNSKFSSAICDLFYGVRWLKNRSM